MRFQRFRRPYIAFQLSRAGRVLPLPAQAYFSPCLFRLSRVNISYYRIHQVNVISYRAGRPDKRRRGGYCDDAESRDLERKRHARSHAARSMACCAYCDYARAR